MGQIFIKGRRGSVYVPDEKAKTLKHDFENGTLPNVIALDNLCFKSNEVKGIELEGEKNLDEKSLADNISDEFFKEHRMLRNISPEIKAQRTGFFELIWFVFTGQKEASKEIIAQAKNLMTTFFKSNPFRIHPDPEIFKELIGRYSPESAPEFKINNSLHRSGGGILMNCLIADRKLARYAESPRV